MSVEFLGFLFAVLLAVAIYGLIEVGRRIGAERFAVEGEEATKGFSAIEGAVFALLGLILAFSFSGALTRFDARRQLVITEANCISTAWLRIDLLPADSQPKMRELFRRYLDSRIEAYHRLPDFAAFKSELAHSTKLQGEIWALAIPSTARSSFPAATHLVATSLNEMFDITTTRTENFRIHSPSVIFGMLGALALACSLFAGYDMAMRKRRNLLHSVSFAVVFAVTVYVIIDIEYPRLGMVNVSDSDQALVDLRKSIE
jgi:hypothetical protein